MAQRAIEITHKFFEIYILPWLAVSEPFWIPKTGSGGPKCQLTPMLSRFY
jgi:hypothetical protein